MDREQAPAGGSFPQGHDVDDEYDEVIAEFLIESYENLDRLVEDLLALEDDPGQETALASVFRTIHTIKGTCGFLGYGRLEGVTHVGENLLSRLRDGALTLDATITTTLLEMVDAVRAMLGAIETTGADGENDYAGLVSALGALADGQAVPTGEGVAPIGDLLVAAGAAAPSAVAAALEAQDGGDARPVGAILVEAGEVNTADVERAVLTQLDSHTPDAPAAEAPAPARSALSDSTIRVDVGVLDQLMNLVGELVLGRNNIMQNVGLQPEPALLMASQQLDLVTGELQECVMKTRMQPIGTVWSRFTRSFATWRCSAASRSASRWTVPRPSSTRRSSKR